MTRLARLALASAAALGCADTNAPPPEPLELLLVANRQANTLVIVPVDGAEPPASVPLGSPGFPTGVAARQGIAVVPLGDGDAVAVIDLLNRRVLQRIQLAEGSGATGAIMVSDSIAYVANPHLNTITRINVFTNETAEVPVGVTPREWWWPAAGSSC